VSLVKDPALAPQGALKIRWAEARMPVLGKIRARMTKERTFADLKIGMCMHIEMKTAVLVKTFQDAGAVIAITGSNPLSTQDDVAAALADMGINVYAWRGVTAEEHLENIGRVLAFQPELIIDDGAELSVAILTQRTDLKEKIVGACEQTTTGIRRLRALQDKGMLQFPVISVSEARTKFLFDSQHGSGQSTLDGVMRTTNLLIAGKIFVVAGYGWVGRGIASRARGLGAQVIITEVDPIRALEALMEGMRVMPMKEACKIGDIFVTATGCRDVITAEHMLSMKDGAILCNSGHFDVEVNVRDLERVSISRRTVRSNVEEFTLPDGRRLYLLSEGRLVNLAAADGHPVEVMDMSFADQALAAEYLLKNAYRLEDRIHEFPLELDREVARLSLEASGVEIDKLTAGQIEYLLSWR
jgi:adenosylhomocysteinase